MLVKSAGKDGETGSPCVFHGSFFVCFLLLLSVINGRQKRPLVVNFSLLKQTCRAERCEKLRRAVNYSRLSGT